MEVVLSFKLKLLDFCTMLVSLFAFIPEIPVQSKDTMSTLIYSRMVNIVVSRAVWQCLSPLPVGPGRLPFVPFTPPCLSSECGNGFKSKPHQEKAD